MGDYRNLELWNRAHQLALAMYRVTANFPVAERHGLTAQMRRAAISIPMNIAEGCGRNTGPELRRFLRICLGSASELEYQVLLCHTLGYLDHSTANDLAQEVDEIKQMLAGLIHRVDRTHRTRPGHPT